MNVARIGVMRKILAEKSKSTRSRLDSYQLNAAVSLSLNSLLTLREYLWPVLSEVHVFLFIVQYSDAECSISLQAVVG
jgi:hypothetical protein